MIVIYMNTEGTAQKVSPSQIYQGSNQSSVTVFANVPTTTAMSIAFKLPDGTNTSYYPMTYISNSDGLAQYEFTLNSSLTQKAGQAAIALRSVFSDGRQTSQLIAFEIEPSVLPELPSSVDEDAYEIIMQYLQKDREDIVAIQSQIDDIQETADNAETAANNAVETANAAKATADGLADSIAQANTKSDNAVATANEAKEIAQEALNQAKTTGTQVEINGVFAEKILFDSDPQTQLNEMVKKSDFDRLILEKEYPVGGKPYIQFPNAPTPAERWAGTTWKIDTAYQGRVLLGSGGSYTLGDTGGSKDAVVIRHNHQQRGHNQNYPFPAISPYLDESTTYNQVVMEPNSEYYITITGAYTELNTEYSGEVGTDKNMQPYIVVNIWKRIA